MVSRLAMHTGFGVASLICILLAHYAAVLPHEYAHSFMAFVLGYKSDPLVIHFGGISVHNLILLINIDEQVDYAAMFARGDGRAAALVGFAGPGLANGTLYLLSLFLLRQPSVRRNAFLYMLVFWFNFMNVANFFDYAGQFMAKQCGGHNHAGVVAALVHLEISPAGESDLYFDQHLAFFDARDGHSFNLQIFFAVKNGSGHFSIHCWLPSRV